MSVKVRLDNGVVPFDDEMGRRWSGDNTYVGLLVFENDPFLFRLQKGVVFMYQGLYLRKN